LCGLSCERDLVIGCARVTNAGCNRRECYWHISPVPRAVVDDAPDVWHRPSVTHSQRLAYLAIPPVLSALFGLYLVHTGSLVPLFVVAGVLTVATARRWPGPAATGALVVMALPYTWSPNTPRVGVGFGLIVGFFLIVAFFDRIANIKPTGFDWAVIAFAVTPGVVAFAQTGVPHISRWVAPEITFAYFGFRLLFTLERPRRVFPTVIVVLGVVLGVLGIYETISGRNPFVSFSQPRYLPNGGFQTTWNVALERSGFLRAFSTFGHPIAFGMFLLIPLAFALARRGRRYVLVTAVCLGAEACTFSRGPWIGVVVVIVLLSGWSRRRVGLLTSACVAAAVFIGPVHRVLVSSGSASTEAGQNALYRFGLLQAAWHHLSAFGQPDIDLQTAIYGYADVTSLFAATALRGGVVGVLELSFIVALSLWAYRNALRTDSAVERAATAALVALLVAMVSVTLVTSYQFFFWALVAFVASLQANAPRRPGISN
jgi:hypothetical protein